jgi:hypothetical protein
MNQTGLISLYAIISSFLQSCEVELICLVQNLNASDLKYQLPIYTAPIKDHQGWEIWEFTKVKQKLETVGIYIHVGERKLKVKTNEWILDMCTNSMCTN